VLWFLLPLVRSGIFNSDMNLKEKIVAILQERSFEIRDAGSKMSVVEETDFEQIALDVIELLARDYSFEADEGS
jgi:ribose 5-phosphate isomerase RpiB